MECYRAIAQGLEEHLAPNGVGVFEVGSAHMEMARASNYDANAVRAICHGRSA